MKMGPNVSWLIGLLYLLSSCGAPGLEVRGELTWIELLTNDGWRLTVDSSGGGTLGYGPQTESRMRFPAGTFDYAHFRQSLSACREGYRPGIALAVRIYEDSAEGGVVHRCLHDSLLARGWLDVAYQSIPNPFEAPLAYQRLQRAWRSYPPLVPTSEVVSGR